MTQTWKQIVAADPEHSRRYAKRWDDMVADGVDIDEVEPAMLLDPATRAGEDGLFR